MQRYFIELAYKGTHYYGWQKQPGQTSVQEVLEDAFTTILGKVFDITGCGRTDTGVHARQYFAHFNFDGDFPPAFLRRINRFLPADIAIQRIFPVHWDAHARFDAFQRSYEYHLGFRKDPFSMESTYFYPYQQLPDLEKMKEAAALLLNYQDFYPFCKSNHGAKTTECNLSRSEWVYDPATDKAIYHVSANRFLRGMVRLIVGACLNIGLGKMSLEELQIAMDRQERLRKSTSAPPEGLSLTSIRYPFIDEAGNYVPPGI